VESLGFSPDGKTLATSSQDQTVRLWNLATYDQMDMFRADGSNIASVAYSPDGTTLVTGSLSSKVSVWNAATCERLGEVKHGAWVLAVAFRRSDSLLATASIDKTIKLWKWDGAALVPVRTLGEHSSGVTAMSYSPDGTKIASATVDGMLYLWDVESGAQLKSARISQQTLRGLAFSPDGLIIAAGGYDKRVELRKADTLEPLGALQGHQEWVWSLTFLPDGKTLASAGGAFDFETHRSNRPGELKLWDVAGLTERLSVEGYEKGIRAVTLSPDGKTLATGDFANLVRLWDVDELLAAARSNQVVLLSGKGVAERKVDTLAEAVQHAGDGDTIEIRGNGPFVSDGVTIGQPLVIRAGEGYAPTITLSQAAASAGNRLDRW
jgi:WD40 repeat protein